MAALQPPLDALRQRALFAAPAFLGAALLFVVQPMLAKWILPAVGGSPSTWTACALFFQTLLLAGYAYAHWISGRLSLRRQVATHGGLLAAAVLVLVLVPGSRSPELSSGTPALAIPWLLLKRVGLPYLMLASSAPLLQHWALRGLGREAAWLYALSNAGSLGGLLAHPFLLEPALSLGAELSAWRLAFGAFGASMAVALIWLWRRDPALPGDARARAAPRPPPALWLRWLGWACVPSVMLLAITQHITLDIAPMPLLWLLPLSLYLLSFVIAFGVWRSAWRGPVLAAWIVGAVALGIDALGQASVPPRARLAGALLALFAACLLCHAELARTRPDPRRLTGFYLVVTAGGALGGALVSLAAPWLFADYYELEVGAILVFVVLCFALGSPGHAPWRRLERLGLFLGAGLAVPILASAVLARARPEGRQGRVLERSRSFLGPLRVVDLPRGRVLTHGHIQHGLQLADPALRRVPTLYFGAGTGVARVLEAGAAGRARRIGVIGLGAGTLASYAHLGDELRFYELDPRVAAIARRDFSFLADSAARVTTVLGDARISLDGEAPQAFDVLVLDAFSSDSVPVHLLTREAFAVYARHLSPDAVLAAHISNRFLALDRVVRASARANGFACVVVETATDSTRHVSHATWALVARDATLLESLASGLPVQTASGREVLWTDARASLFSILR